MMTEEERWDAAVAYAREMLEVYKEIPNGMFGAISIQTKIGLYEEGDRSEALLLALEGIS